MNRQHIEDVITRLVIALSTAALLWLPVLAPIREPLVDALAQAIPDAWTPPITAAGALTVWGLACIVFATFSAGEHVEDAYRDRRRQNASGVTDPMGDPS